MSSIGVCVTAWISKITEIRTNRYGLKTTLRMVITLNVSENVLCNFSIICVCEVGGGGHF